MALKEKIDYIALHIYHGSFFYPGTPKEIREITKIIPHYEYQQPGGVAEVCRIWHLVDCLNYFRMPDYFESHPDWKGEKLKKVKETCERLKPIILSLER